MMMRFNIAIAGLAALVLAMPPGSALLGAGLLGLGMVRRRAAIAFMDQKKHLLLAASAFIGHSLILALPVCAASITDASFEAPAVGSSFRYNPAVSGVTFTAGAGVQGNGSAWGFANAPDGTQTAFLQSFLQTGGFASIAMAVTGLEVGQSYTVSFWESRRPNYGLNPYSVSFEGTQIYSGAPASAVWTRVTTASFIAAAMTGTLTFSSGPKNGDNDTGHLSANPTPTSEVTHDHAPDTKILPACRTRPAVKPAHIRDFYVEGAGRRRVRYRHARRDCPGVAGHRHHDQFEPGIRLDTRHRRHRPFGVLLQVFLRHLFAC
jgi:hypothetical protein